MVARPGWGAALVARGEIAADTLKALLSAALAELLVGAVRLAQRLSTQVPMAAWIFNGRPRLAVTVRDALGLKLQPLYAAGGRLAGIYSVGPLVEGVGLNVTVWSYLDRIHVGVLGCHEHWPDLHAVTDGMRAALDELLARMPVGSDAPS